MAKLCTPSNERKCRMTHSAGTVFLFLLFSVWCLIFFMFHGGVGVRRARNSFYLLFSHHEYVCPMNCYNGITVKMHKNGLYAHAHQFIIFVVFFGVCVFIAYSVWKCVQYESDLDLSAHAELNIARHFFQSQKPSLHCVPKQFIVIWIGFVQ